MDIYLMVCQRVRSTSNLCNENHLVKILMCIKKIAVVFRTMHYPLNVVTIQGTVLHI